MSFYTQKVKAFKLIDKLFDEKKSLEQIQFIVESNFGFSKKMIQNRVELLKNYR